jgi:signal transduction histidine kinase
VRYFGLALSVAAVPVVALCILSAFSTTVWWGSLGLFVLWAVSLAFCIRIDSRKTRRARQEWDAWHAVGGDLRIIFAAGRGPKHEGLPLLSVDSGFERVLGWTPKEMIGVPWQDFIHPDDLNVTWPELQRLDNGTFIFANRWRHKQAGPAGGPRWVWLEWSAMTDEKAGLTYASGRDMTAHFEREVQMSTWSRITHNLMAVGDLSVPMEERKFEWVNEAWSRQLRWSPSEIYNMRIVDFIDILTGGQVTDSWSVVDQFISLTLKCRIRCKAREDDTSDNFRFYEWTSINLNGHIYVTGRDEGKEHQYKQDMAKAIADLESRNADLERFASVAAHQLRSPPRTIAGIAQAIKEDYGHLLDDEGQQFLEDIRLDADQMAEVVDGLYRFSKVRTSADMHIEPVDLNEVMQSIREVRAKKRCTQCPHGPACPRARKPPYDCPNKHDLIQHADLPVVLGNRLLMREVMTNLVDNGFKFNEAEHKLVTVTAKSVVGGRWEIKVVDNGIGIDPQYHHKLFQMFERVHPRYAGTGVGLALVAAIINKLGGSIEVDSDIGGGTTFTFDVEGAWIG